MNNTDDYSWLVLDIEGHRRKTEPVMGSYKTEAEARERAKQLNRTHNDPNGLKRYLVFEVGDREHE